MFDVIYLSGGWWVVKNDESESFGPYNFYSEACEKQEELNDD